MLLFSALCLLLNCKSKSEPIPKAVSGLLNLKNIDSSIGYISLDGEWEFFMEEFIDSSKDSVDLPSNSFLLNVPGNWNQVFSNGRGFGSYRLKVVLPDHWNFPIAVKLFEQGTAYKLFINGKEITKNGSIGKNKETSLPQAFPLVSKTLEHSGTLDIVFHISNFHFREGGLWYPIILGNAEQLRLQREYNINLDMFLLGSILIMGIYHLVLYLIRKRDKSPLWFALFCFDIIFRLISFNEKYIHTLYPNLSYQLATQIEYLAYYFAVPLFSQFLYSIYPEIFYRKILNIIWIVASLFIAIVLFTNSEFFSHTAPFFHIFASLNFLYYLLVIGRALYLKKESAIYLFFGTSVLIAGTLNDILYSMEFIKSSYLVPQSLLIFIFIQSVILSYRFSNAFKENERLAIRLYELNESLERKVTERTMEYKKEKDKVEQVGKVKDKFVSIVSHDLRTPMIGISNVLELLKTEKYVKTVEERNKLLNICHESVLHSLEMIKQLLNFSRIETGTLQLKYEKVQLKDYLDFLLIDSISQAKFKNIEIHIIIEEIEVIIVDPEFFSHALKNIVSNSIKFSNPFGNIWINVYYRDDSVFFRIKDEGIGMDSKKLNGIFNPEEKITSLGTRGETGHGMGLFICKYIVEAHKGKVYFESEVGNGFLCTIRLPNINNY
jgi:signal transduction histidine kinase